MKRKEIVTKAIETVLESFKSNPQKVALAVFRNPRGSKPSDSWSFFNRIIMFMNNTLDARGFRQWQKAGRKVKKGAKAFHIIAPIKKKVPLKVTAYDEDGNEIEEIIMVEKIIGFTTIPVFRYEDTEGDPLPEENYNVEIPYQFKPLLQELGITIKTTSFSGYFYGLYNLTTNVITLASPEITIFLHELSHAVDNHLHGDLTGGQTDVQEITAELSAATIGYIMGYKVPFGNVKEYIERYGTINIIKALNRVQRIVEFVIEKTKVTEQELTNAGY